MPRRRPLPSIDSFASKSPQVSSLFLGFLYRLVRLSPAGAAQNIFQRVIGFVAGVLINVLVRSRPGVFAGTRLRPCRRIFDGEAVEQRVRTDSREALDHMHGLGGSSEPGLVG